MAANTKAKRKVKGKTLDLNAFLGEDDAPSGFAVVQPRRIDWADTMENEDIDDRYTLDYKKEEKVVLPTAPKATRGPDFDERSIPSNPPFTAYLGNLPYDISEEDITAFFRQLQVKNIRLPRDNGDRGRIRGFGYAEFHTRTDLIDALTLNNETLKSRAIKISLSGEHDGDRGNDRRNNDGIDRTSGDWRMDRKEQMSRDEPMRNDSYQSRGGGGGGFMDRDNRRTNYDGFSRGGFERNDRNGDRFDRHDFGSRNDREFGNRNDREFGRDQDRFDRRGPDRGYGFDRGPDRDRGMNQRGGSAGGRFERREGGYGRRDDFQRDGRYGRESSDRDYPPRDSYERRPPPFPSERPPQEAGMPVHDEGKERRKLQLAPRTKPIEPTPAAESSSSIFGGAKPVDTAAKEREIEARLLAKEREGSVVKDPREAEIDSRVRKISSGSGISNRSRRSSDSNPPNSLRDDEHVTQYKPPVPKQSERDTQPYHTLPQERQRCGSTSSTGSDREGRMNALKSNHIAPSRKDNYSNYYGRDDNPHHGSSEDSSYGDKGGFRQQRHNHSHRDNSKDRVLQGIQYEEPKTPVYTSANKFQHLMNDTDDYDRENSE